MIFEPVKKFRCQHLEFGFASEPWELNDYWNIRKEIFCEEQHLFEESDRDMIDACAIPIIAVGTCMGMNDQVVGVVRIDERRPGIWYGGRLGVTKDYRRLSRFQAYHLFRNNQLVEPYTMSVGAALIYKAVSTANALGCQQFLANVQHQNVPLFHRLHWKSMEEITLLGVVHHVMEADLDYYPASAFVSDLIQLSA